MLTFDEKIRALTALPGVSGREEAVRDFIQKEIGGCGRCTIDALGNLIVEKEGRLPAPARLMVTAHMDEVGFLITHIEENGLLRFAAVGGVSPEVAAGKRVFVGEKGLPGLIGLKAVHQQKAAERTAPPELDSLYIDIGARSREEAEAAVALGDRVNFAQNYAPMGTDLLRARALDNRVGCAILMELLEGERRYGFTAVFTVQEETGCQGAKAAAGRIRPDAALILETTTASDLPGNDGAEAVCRLGRGPVVSYMDRGTIYPLDPARRLAGLGKELGLATQMKSRVAGGNEARAVQTAAAGAVVMGLSVPCRYLHSQAVVMSRRDAADTLRLAAAAVDRLEELL